MANKIALGLFVGCFLLPGVTMASPPEEDQHEISLCHATGSAENPWQVVEVDPESLNGHGDHENDIYPITDLNADELVNEADCVLAANPPDDGGNDNGGGTPVVPLALEGFGGGGNLESPLSANTVPQSQEIEGFGAGPAVLPSSGPGDSTLSFSFLAASLIMLVMTALKLERE